MERDAYLQSLFYISFRVPSKEALSPGSLHRAPTERDAPSSETPYNNLSEFLVNGLPWGDVHALSPPPIFFQIPRKELPEQSSHREGCSLSGALQKYSDNNSTGSPTGP
jgi:hypothetical protein